MGRLLRYKQTVTQGGYQWVVEKPLPRPGQEATTAVPLLTDGTTWDDDDILCRRYNALAKQGLYRTFAGLWVSIEDSQTDGFKDRLARFASRYGLLGTPQYTLDDFRTAEAFDDWREASRRMHLAVELWDCIDTKNLEALRDRIRWSEGRVFYRTEALRLPVNIAREDVDAVRWDHLDYNGVIRPAQWLLQEWVNEALRESLSGRVLWAGRLGEARHFEFHFEPASLLSTLWCQLALEVAGEAKPLCEYCGKPLENVQRRTKRYCNNVCRAQHSKQERRRDRDDRQENPA